MTAQCHLTGGQFPSETGRLGSHGPRPFPQARASLPPTCARTTTPHSTPAPSGPGGPRGEQFSFGLSSLSQFYLSTPQGQAQEAGALQERLPPAEPVPGPRHEASAAHPTDEEWGSEQRGHRARSPQPVRARARPRPCEIPEGLRRTPAPRGRLGNAAAPGAGAWSSARGRDGKARLGSFATQVAPEGAVTPCRRPPSDFQTARV